MACVSRDMAPPNMRLRARKVVLMSRAQVRAALLVGAWTAALPASAATFGVPRGLLADGRACTAAGTPAGCGAISLDPPGWLILTGISDVDAAGDTVHQMRFFIEVTGTTLDLKIFDPGNDGMRDGNAGSTVQSTTSYELFQPDGTTAGANYRVQNYGGDMVAGVPGSGTDNRLNRLSFGGTFTAANAGNAFGTLAPGTNTALAPGIWELRVTDTNAGTANRKTFGIDVRDSGGNHYNVYTISGDDDAGSGTAPGATDTALVVGALSAATGGGYTYATPTATITQEMIFYPYVNRGCTVQTSSFDGDNNGSSDLTDLAEPTPITTTLTTSGATAQSTNTLTVESTAAPNLESLNYGIWTQNHDTGTQFNIIDWRYADYRGWADAPAGLPRDPNSAIRVYLPNGYTGAIPPLTNATAPLEPSVKTSTRWISGPNPPTTVGTTVLAITATVTNPYPAGSGFNLSNVVITIPLATNVVYIAGTQGGFIDGVQPGTLCADADATNISVATARRCNIGTLNAGSFASLNINVNFSPTANPQNITGAPPAAVAGTNAIAQLTRQAVGLARAEFAANPNYVIGQYVTIAGAAQNGYNGLARVTNVFAGAPCTVVPARFCINYVIPTLNIAAGNDGGAAKTATANAADPECPYTANGPVCAHFTPAFSSATWPEAESLGPVCNLVSNVGTGAALATRATIRGLRVTGSAVEFVTGSQQGAVAFNVYAVRASAPPLLVGRAAAVMPDSTQPIFYRVETGPLPSSRLLIEEIDKFGRRHVMGPFSVDDQRLRAAFEAQETHLVQGGPVESRGASRRARVLGRGAAKPRFAITDEWLPSTRRARRGVKIEIDAPGWVEVSLDDLRANGLPPHLSLDEIHLTNRGRSVDFVPVPGPNGPAAIGFSAEALSTDYTGKNVYVVTWGRQAPAMPAALTRSEDPLDPAFLRAERNALYLASASPTGDPWFWGYLFGDGSPWPYPGANGAFDLPGLQPASGATAVRIRVFAWSNGEHTLDASVNGARVLGDQRFTGIGYHTFEGTIEASALRAADNELSLSYRAGAPDDQGLYLNYVEFAGAASVGPGRVLRVLPFDPGVPGSIERAEYLIVTHPAFLEQAERLAALKRREGLTTAVVDVEDVYDRYAAGIVEANAIRELIKNSFDGGRLRYVLLFGDDTFDNHDYLETGARSFVPSLLSWDGQFGRVPSENLYADADEDGKPDVAIGRLPAQTVDEARALVEKIERQTASLQASAGKHLFAIDNQSPGDISFAGEADRAASLLPRGSSIVRSDITAGVDAARATLFDSLRRGVFATHYFGHGGVSFWADESLLSADDVASLAGTPETLVFMWACESQWYLSLDGDSLGEALLLLPRGGAAASFGPSGVTDAALQPLLFEPLYAGLNQRGVTLGQAIMKAKRAAAAEPRGELIANGWNLLGDPALKLR